MLAPTEFNKNYDFLTLSLDETSTTSNVLLLLLLSSCNGSFEPHDDTRHYGVLLDDPHERRRPLCLLLVDLSTMRLRGTHAQLAPS